jgi:hypothetical protein
MAIHRLLSLILIVPWYPHSESALTGTKSGESTKGATCAAPTATWCAPGRLVEELDDKETNTSDVKILKASGDEIPGMSSNGEMLRSVGHEMLKHDTHAAFADCKDRYVIDVTRCLDFPDYLVTQHDDPLNTPQSGTSDVRFTKCRELRRGRRLFDMKYRSFLAIRASFSLI